MWSVYINRHQPEQPFHFRDLIALQQEVLARIRPTGESALLFAELPPTVTLGARQMRVLEEGQDPSLGLKAQALRGLSVEVVAGERGGNETWHGPGQWVGFVLTPLYAFTGHKMGVRLAVMKILDLILPSVRQFVPDARIEDGARLGIWSDQGKLASIGIQVREGYTSSGFALNCIPNPQAFLGMDPCGIAGARPDFLFASSVPEAQWNEVFRRVPEMISADFKKTVHFFK